MESCSFKVVYICYFAKIMQMSAMKACFQIAECSLSVAKIVKNTLKDKKLFLENDNIF